MYYCKNCGEPYMTDEAVMCIKCGVAKGQGNNYCHNCGKPLAPDAAVCLNCGVANKQAPAPDAKSKLVAGLLGIFLGTFGVHNFYLGYTGKAITQLVLTIVGYIYLRGLPIVWILLSRLRRNQSGKCTACRTSSVSNLVSSTGNLYRCYLWRFYADTDSCQITYRWDQRMEVP